MGRLIDIDVLFDYFGNDAIDKTTRSNIEYFVSEKGTVKAIPKAGYENRLKADLKAILVELQLEIKEMDSGCGWEGYRPTAQVLEVIQQKINELPSVTPIRPKGRWIDKQHLCGYCSAECSSCHKRSNGYVHDNGFSLEYKYYDFCPNCGAKMVEPQESEGT